MHAPSSASRTRPRRNVAGLVGYAALITFVVVLFADHGPVMALAGAATLGLLVGSYLLERWARRHTVYGEDVTGGRS